MPIIEEDGGRLNAFAKEPRMEIIDQDSSNSKTSWILIIAGMVLVGGLIAITISIS